MALVGNEPLAFGRQRRFDHRVPARSNVQHCVIDNLRPRPPAFSRALGLPGRHIEPGQRLRGHGDGLTGCDRAFAQLLEMRFLSGERMAPGLRNPRGFFVQRNRVEAHRPGHGLPMRKWTARRHQRVGMLGRNFDEIAQHPVVTNLERGNPGIGAVLGLQRGDGPAGIA